MTEVHKIESAADLESAFRIRKIVFVEGQNVPEEEEYDEFEDTSVHFLATVGGVPAGTARWRRTDKGIKMERFAVLEQFRGMGVGGLLVKTVLTDLPEAPLVYLHSQTQVTGLYAKYGFKPVGDEFEEAGILHYKMVLCK